MPPTSKPIAALLALLALGACSKGGRTELRYTGEGAFRRLALEPAGAPAERETRITERLPAPRDGLAPWRADAPGEPSLIQWPGDEEHPGRPIVALPGPGDRRVGIPGSFDPATFNQIAVTYLSQGEEHVYVRLMRRGRPVVGSRTLVGEHAPVPRVLLFDLPQTRLVDEAFDEIVVHFECEALPHAPRGQAAGLAAVDLLARPPAGWLPEPERPRLVEIAEERRRGTGLGTERPLRSKFRLEGPSYLDLSYGRHADVDRPGQKLELVVRLAGGGKEQVERFPLDDAAAGGKPPWQHALIATALPAGPVEARFELESKDGREAWCALGEPALFRPTEGAPTVLLVTSDTHRADHLGAAGSGIQVETPVLDALAARGVLFEDCFSSTNVTNPSHVALMTATNPRDTGVWNNDTRLADTAPTLAERFQEAGFLTFAATSAHHLDDPVSGLGQGFDRMSGPRHADRPAQATIDVLERWLEHAEGRPLFVWLHLFDAHSPYGPPAPFDRKYYPKDRDPFSKDIPLAIDERLIPRYMAGLRDVEFPKAQYRAEVDYLDDQLGRLLGRERFRSGVVAVTADHGESFGQHEIWWDHADLYPDSIHVPLILAWPQAPAGTRVTVPVRQIDLPRTLLDLAGLARSELPGQSLLATIEQGDALVEEPRFALSFARHSAAVTYQGWHLILHLHDHAIDHGGVYEPRRRHRTELYDLRADLACEDDLVWKELPRARRMREMLVRWLLEAAEENWSAGRTQDAEGLRQLGALGYATGTASGGDGDLFDPECKCADWCARF